MQQVKENKHEMKSFSRLSCIYALRFGLHFSHFFISELVITNRLSMEENINITVILR